QIGTAFIDVEARTDSASGALSRFASGAVKAIAGVVAGIGAIGVGLTGLAVKGGISRALDTEDAIVQMRRIGLSAQEIEGVVADVDKAFDGTIFTNPEGFALTQRLIGAGVELDAVGGHVQTIGDFAAHG